MKNRRNLYRILHVGPDAPTEVIQASYRTLMQRLKMHPDLGGDHAQATLVNEAYATLSDPARRAAYDKTLAGTTTRRRGAPPQAAPSNPPAAPKPPATPREAQASARTSTPPRTTPDAPGSPTPPRKARPGTRRPSSPPTTTACNFCGVPFVASLAEDPDSTCAACGSSLSPVTRHHANDASRRAIERVSRNMPVTFYRSQSPNEALTGTTEDFSLNGLRLLSDQSLSIGEPLRMECGFCSAVAIVRSQRRDEGLGRIWHCGVEFLTLRIKRERGGLVSTAG